LYTDVRTLFLLPYSMRKIDILKILDLSPQKTQPYFFISHRPAQGCVAVSRKQNDQKILREAGKKNEVVVDLSKPTWH
jgi:hypothetical protein